MHTEFNHEFQSSGNVTGYHLHYHKHSITSHRNVTRDHLPNKHSIIFHRTGVLDYFNVGTSNSRVKHVLCTVIFLKIEDCKGEEGGGGGLFYIWVNIASLWTCPAGIVSCCHSSYIYIYLFIYLYLYKYFLLLLLWSLCVCYY
jgi:hypothetical protein